MQTFLPYESFTRSIKCLDDRRLGKQRVEAMQILNVLAEAEAHPDRKIAWRNHPAVKMWKGFEVSLALYHDLAIAEWVIRGFRNNMNYLRPNHLVALENLPWWVGNEGFHASHRSALLRKDCGFYSQYGWTEEPDLPYVWPVR